MTDRTPFPDPPTDAEIEAAKRFGVSVGLYRRFKRNAGPDAGRLERGDGPADIVAEEHLAEKMRRGPGLFKPRNKAPSILVSAARTPGEVAQTLLTISCYLGLMFLIIGLGGEKVQRVPGVFQVIALGLLVIPAMTISSLVWRSVGEGMRDRVRLLVRFWPLTLMVLIFLLGGVRLLLD